MPDSPSDILMCLRSHDGACTKTHTREPDGWQTDAYRAGYLFDAAATDPLGGIADLSGALSALENKPDCLVIRGGLVSGQSREDGVLRRKHARGNERAYFEPIDRRWICVDIDDAPAIWPGGAPPSSASELESWVGWTARTYLPGWLQGVDTHWQWSSSAGVHGWETFNIHLWFWLDRPAANASLRDWFRDVDYIDHKLFNAVQPHFTAAPIFEGADDPIGQMRSGLLRIGSAEASPPAEILDQAGWEAKQAAEQKQREAAREDAKRRARERVPCQSGKARVKYAARALDQAVDVIVSAGKGARHDALYREAAAIGELVAADVLDHHQARTRLVSAGEAAYSKSDRIKDVPRIVNDALEQGMQTPRDLSHIGGRKRRRRRDVTSRQDRHRTTEDTRSQTPDPDVEPFDDLEAELAQWPPMVRRRWMKLVVKLRAEYGNEIDAQLVATSRLREDGGTLPPYLRRGAAGE